ncbi:hypothetical protein BsWGS_28898 [Bradybaena similaris]
METGLLSSETLKIEPDFETKPSGPIFPLFIKQEIKSEADIEVDSESWTNAQEVYSLDRNLQDCKTEAGTRNKEVPNVKVHKYNLRMCTVRDVWNL